MEDEDVLSAFKVRLEDEVADISVGMAEDFIVVIVLYIVCDTFGKNDFQPLLLMGTLVNHRKVNNLILRVNSADVSVLIEIAILFGNFLQFRDGTNDLDSLGSHSVLKEILNMQLRSGCDTIMMLHNCKQLIRGNQQ